MARRTKKNQKSQAKLEGYVVVAFAEDIEQAREYTTLLEANDIHAVISEHEEQSTGSNEIAVMVPEEYLDEAHVVIESQQAYDDFYDFALDEEDDVDFDGDLFDEDM
ncbi:MAG: hypothetical protein JW715_08200 [Sedimentisphaerales bacterium]|nr:hypothetical protein [Sedimentisphaerales bacterium]